MPSVEERLAAIEVNTVRIIKLLDGNGQPGILTEFVRMDERLAAFEKKEEQRMRAGIAGGIVGATSGTGLFSGIVILLQRLGVIQI